jgi:hypothetical protein
MASCCLVQSSHITIRVRETTKIGIAYSYVLQDAAVIVLYLCKANHYLLHQVDIDSFIGHKEVGIYVLH